MSLVAALRHGGEAFAVYTLETLFRAAGTGAARHAGGVLGTLARRLGVRAHVAKDNLRHAFPGLSEREREAILAAHFRELGHVVAEYPRIPELARAPIGEHVVELEGLEHLQRARAAGRGAILIGAHYSSFELSGAVLAQIHPVAFVVRPMSNPRVDAWIANIRRRAKIHIVDSGRGIRGVYEALRANQWVAMLADQDARRKGVFVPFMGRLASTAIGPARIALATGAPIVMGRIVRRSDGRHDLRIGPTLEVPDVRAPDAPMRLTAAHVAVVEQWVRERPELWFWLHRRWKTRPPEEAAHASL